MTATTITVTHDGTCHAAVLPTDAERASVPLAAIQSAAAAEAKRRAYQHLAPTDWYVTRLSETGEAIPDAIAAQRAAVRAWATDREAAIAAATSAEDIEAIPLTFGTAA